MNQSESAVLGKQDSFIPMKRSQSGDRISELPDAILGHILSFAPFKQSVQTSILSKRWLHVWKYLPLIHVDDSKLVLHPIVVAEQSVHSSFINFMTNVFNRSHEAPILKFILKCYKFDVFHVNQWIIAAVKCRIQELDLCVTLRKKFKISCGLFAYQELVTLKLGESFILHVPGSLVFPNLQKLRLDGIEFDDDTIHNFLSGCPVLEDLHIKCPTEKLKTLVIKVPALKFFTLVLLSYNEDTGAYDNHFKFILETPNLEVLNYCGFEALKGFCFGNLNSLVKAKFSVATDEYKSTHGIDIVRAVVNAKSICLSDSTLKIISSMDVCHLPIFHNLSELRLGLSNFCRKKGLFFQLLHNSPNLEVLVLDADVAMGGNKYAFRWERPRSVPSCFYRNLKVVNILGYEEKAWVGEFIRYVLHNAKGLKECTSDLPKPELIKI